MVIWITCPISFGGGGTRFFKGSETPYEGRIKVHGLIGLDKDRISQLNY
jgi:hypothetical protein